MATSVDCLSDTHLGADLHAPDSASNAYFPGKVNRLPPAKREECFQEFWEETRRAYHTVLSWLKEQNHDGPIHHLGDVCSGYKERGVSDPHIYALSERVLRDLRATGRDVFLCIGNHDVGYEGAHDLFHTRTSIDGIEAAKDLYGQLYWKYVAEDVLSLGICSAVADHESKDPRIVRCQEDQGAFIAEALKEHRGKPWILYAHDPLSVRNVRAHLQPHVRELRHFITGDWHNARAGTAARSIASRLTFLPGSLGTLAKCLQKLTVVPSTAPLWTRGYGALTLEIGTRDSVKIVALPRPPDSIHLPESHFLRAAWARALYELPMKGSRE